MKTGQTIARNSLWLILDTFVSTVATFAASVAVARVLGPKRVGYFNYLTFIAAMAQLVAQMGVPLAARKFAAELRGRGDLGQLRALIDATARFQHITTSILVVFGLGFVYLVVPREHWSYAFITVISIAPAILLGVPSALLWSTENVAPNTKASLISIGVNLIGVLLSLLFHWDLTGLAASLLASRTVDYVLRRRLAARAYRELPVATGPMAPDLRARLVRFCWAQSVLLAIEVVIWQRSEVLFVEHFTDTRQVAFFSNAFNVVANLFVLPMALSSSAGITMMVRQGQAPQEVGRLAGTAMWFIALFAVPVTFGVSAIADPLVRVMYGREYLEAIPVLTLMAAFGVARALSYPILDFLTAVERQSFVVRWTLLVVPVNLTLAYLLVPQHGAWGAALVKGLTHSLTVAGLWVYAVRAMKVDAPIARYAKLIACAILMMLSVRFVVTRLSPVPGLIVGVPTGIILMVVLLRVTGCADAQDGERLASLQRMIPGRLRGIYMALVRFLVPPPAGTPSPLT